MNAWIDTPDSSTIRRFCWDPGTGELTVEFNKGSNYVYSDVEDDVFSAMVDAVESASDSLSVGKYFAKHVRGVYDFKKSEAPSPA